MLFLLIFFGGIIAIEVLAIILLVLAFLKVHQWEQQLFHLKTVFPKYMKVFRTSVKAARNGGNMLQLLQWPKLPLVIEVAQWTFLALAPGGLFSVLRAAKR